MLDQQRKVSRPAEERQQLFTQRYERLLGWALRLTNYHRQSAEDLVQDAFVQFVLSKTALESIDNLDGYLRRMLRYMYLSRINRNAQVDHAALSIADYDSFLLSRTAIEPSRRMLAQEELCEICRYACSRKETSRAGGVLILRFFHDYQPSEIAEVLCSSRHSIDEWQRVARREVKLLLTDAGRLRFAPAKPVTGGASIKQILADCDLLDELRRMIFRSREGECLTLEQLRGIYELGDAETLTTARVGHIVSCASCLDQVNRLLGLPLLAERFRAWPCGPETPPDDRGSGGPGNGTGDLESKCQRRLREVVEHRPQELRIAVNGSLVSSLKVAPETNELKLSLEQHEIVEFVEVYSEQNVQLLFFTISQPLRTEDEQSAIVELSDGRTLAACLRFESGPTLHVVYNELAIAEAQIPSMLKLVKAEPQTQALRADDALEVPDASLSGVSQNVDSLEPIGAPADDLGNANSRSRFGLLFHLLNFRIRAAMTRHQGSLHATFKASPLAIIKEDPPSNAYEFGSMDLLGRPSRATAKPIWSRPEFVALVLSAVVIGAFLYFKASIVPTISATNLLAQATLAEQSRDRIPDQVSHRIINLEERRSAEGALVSRRKIEIWQDFTRGERAQRLYDESNQLIAGAWQRADGSRTVYHHGARSRQQPAPSTTDTLLLNLEDVWQLELSAKEFNTLIAGAADVHLDERSTSYVISVENARAIGASLLLKATLTLSRLDLHPIEQTLLVKRGEEIREYRFVEVERLSQKGVDPSVFEPEFDGGGHDKGRSRVGEAATINSPPFLPLSSSVHSASPELEVDVAYLLNRAKGDRSEQVTLTRSTSGSLCVEGVVDTEQRKSELLSALAPVSNNPAVTIEIHTIAEAVQRARLGSAPAAVTEMEETADTIAADKELRAYISRKDTPLKTGDSLDEAVRSFSSRMVNRGYRALFHAIELQRLVTRFARIDMHTLTPDARAKWLEMVKEQAAAFESETAVLRQEMQPVFLSGPPITVVDEFEIGSDADLTRAGQRLHHLALENNEAIRAAFTISSQSSAAAVKSSQFWRSLIETEKLAAQIKRYGG
jgi:RNA polymerase sigma factor (sigma-70 family)